MVALTRFAFSTIALLLTVEGASALVLPFKVRKGFEIFNDMELDNREYGLRRRQDTGDDCGTMAREMRMVLLSTTNGDSMCMSRVLRHICWKRAHPFLIPGHFLDERKDQTT